MFDSVLLPIDVNHPESWEKALPLALRLAGADGTLHILGIVHDIGSALVATYLPDGYEEQTLKKMADDLDAFRAKHVPEDVKAATHVGHGHVPERILGAAESVEADLIVMASHPPDDLRNLLVASSADKVVRHSPVPVLVVR